MPFHVTTLPVKGSWFLVSSTEIKAIKQPEVIRFYQELAINKGGSMKQRWRRDKGEQSKMVNSLALERFDNLQKFDVHRM